MRCDHRSSHESNQAFNNRVSTGNRILFLDYLRIFAFASVFAGHKYYHFIEALSVQQESHALIRFAAACLLPFIYGGAAGVVVFFLVSGYIITKVLQSEHSLEFIVKRLFRIYPLYIFAVLLYSVVKWREGYAIDFSSLLKQLLLIGDFFGTPYSLNGVEWTLRVEMYFYTFMAMLRSLNAFKYHAVVYVVCIAVIALCFFAAPIPSHDVWSKAYLNVFGPFLLLGSMFYFYELKKINLRMLVVFCLIVYLNFYALLMLYQPRWLDDPFALLALIMFALTWLFRSIIIYKFSIKLLSDLTFAVYLFHNWLYDSFVVFFMQLHFHPLFATAIALISFVAFCFVTMSCIEKPGVRLGGLILSRLIHRMPVRV